LMKAERLAGVWPGPGLRCPGPPACGGRGIRLAVAGVSGLAG